MAVSTAAKRWLLILLAGLLAGCAGRSPTDQVQPAAQAPTALPSSAPATVSPSATPTIAATVLPTALASPVPPTAVPTAIPPSAVPTSLPAALPAWSYPIGLPGRPLGDGFIIRHGFQTENTWYNPGYWHTGEDWYAQNNGETAGATVYAVAAGTVVYAGSNYPGRVVIIKHADDLFSMYGHLALDLPVREGQSVDRGALIGRVFKRSDNVPSHLHFEIRTFLTTPAVNGAHPRYGFRCGPNCPPGPGYWPIRAPDVPSDQGWRTPIHVINQRAFAAGALYQAVVATQPVSSSVTLWSAPPGAGAAQPLADLPLQPGAQFTLRAVQAGPEAPHDTSANTYQLWYQIALPSGATGWVQALVPVPSDTGSDGHPSSVAFNFIPAITIVP